MLTFLTGFFAGLAHVLSGPDHLAAVTPFSINFRKKAWIIGFSWGLGHTLGALLIGVVFVLFKEFIPVEFISSNSERIIGIMLIVIGVWAISRIFLKRSSKKHAHPHIHTQPEPVIHIHKHSHSGSEEHEHEHIKTTRQSSLTAMGIGVFHGVAGFSHLMAVLPSLILPGRIAPGIYLSAFGLGTISTMVAFTYTLGIIAYKLESAQRYKLLKWISFSGGIIAVVIGMVWLLLPVL